MIDIWGLRGWVFGKSDGESFVKVGEVRSRYVYQSMLNRFYVGRTDIFLLPARQDGLVVFANPPDSRRRTFIQAVTVTSNLGRRSIFWFDAGTPLPLTTSKKWVNTHRGAREQPQTRIQLGSAPNVSITAGIDVFERLLVGKQTLLLEQEGKFILDPGHNHSVSFPSVDRDDEIDVAFGWWEEPLTKPPAAHR